MRLINVKTSRFEEFLDDETPPYAILSHTWGDASEELTFRDVLGGKVDKPGVGSVKFRGSCGQAEKDGLKFVWIDTCCIDKDSSAELSEAIRSMFRWYKRASICYTYLADVPRNDILEENGSRFRSSRWFRRGWTLQELLAPESLQFYDSKWHSLGNKGGLSNVIGEITGVPVQFLLGIAELDAASVAQRMSWAAHRDTKKKEDLAYCLLGIFGVTMPIMYGEGGDQAFFRLQDEIMKKTKDDSILAWGLNNDQEQSVSGSGRVTAGRILAAAPSDFSNSGHIVSREKSTASINSFDISGGSLRLRLSLLTIPTGDVVGLLNCGPENDTEQVVGIPLAKVVSAPPDEYLRPEGYSSTVQRLTARVGPLTLVHVRNYNKSKNTADLEKQYWLYNDHELAKVNLKLAGVSPQSCWHPERSMIISTISQPDSASPQILVRLRHINDNGSQDFVIGLGLTHQGSHTDAECSVMICSRDLSLEELAGKLRYVMRKASGKSSASNGLVHIHVNLVSNSRQPIFIIKTEVLSHAPSDTVNATVELKESLESIETERKMLKDKLRRLEERRREVLGYSQDANNYHDGSNITRDAFGWAIKTAKGVAQTFFGLNPDQEIKRKINAEYVANVTRAFQNTPAERFFKHNTKFIAELAEKAAALADDPDTSICGKDMLLKTSLVTMHQQVLYCDDSSSMKRENRWNSQNMLINRIARVTTQILPEGEGVYIRYINQPIANDDSLKLEDLRKVIEPLTWGGGTLIGTNLRSKILEPLVYRKLPDNLKRPLLVSVITDGTPEGERQSTFVDAIAECGDKLEAAGLPRESVKFMIGQVGSAFSSRRFLQSISEELKIADVVFVAPEALDVTVSKFPANWEVDKWLIETLYATIVKNENKNATDSRRQELPDLGY